MGRHTVNSTAPEGRRIRNQLRKINPSNSYEQLQSPLFNKIPPEIRNLIFELAVTQHDDSTSPSSALTKWRYYHTHFGPKFHWKVYTDLLSTCRRIYYETNCLPMRCTTHYMNLKFRAVDKTVAWFSRLTAKNIDELERIHFCLTIDYFEYFSKISQLPQFQPKHITLSFMQLNHFSTGSPSLINELGLIFDSICPLANSVELFTIECESWAEDLNGMDALVKETEDQIQQPSRSWHFERRDGKRLLREKSHSSIRQCIIPVRKALDKFFIVTYVFKVEK
jgi:hypothetical protein